MVNPDGSALYSEYDRMEPHSIVVDCSGDVVLTKQEFARECDINAIMERFQVTGMQVDPGAVLEREAFFGDFSADFDFFGASNYLLESARLFDALPSKIRDRFGNDPFKLLVFMSDVANKDEAVALGLVRAPEDRVPPVAPPGPAQSGTP